MDLPAPFFDFLPRLHLAYRAVGGPQRVTIEAALASPDPGAGLPVRMRMLLEAINGGAAGGELLAPSEGFARLLSGPIMVPGHPSTDPGPRYRWELEVAGIAPSFWRIATAVLAFGGAPIPLTDLAILGSERVDDSSWSITGPALAMHMKDVQSFPGVFPTLPFEVQRGDIPQGCAIRIHFTEPLTPDLAERLGDTLAVWGVLTVGCPCLDGAHLGGRTFVDRLGITTVEYSRFIEDFDYLRNASEPLLLNMLARFCSIAPIAWVDLRMP